MSTRFRGIMFLSIIEVAVPALGGVPNEIHHQGVIAVHGERFTGEGDFYFALVDELGYNLWTNDGTKIDPPSQECPDSPVTLTVVNGVYRVRLGNTADGPSMTAIPRAVFNENDHVALRIWFDDGINGIHQLSPDQLLTGAPYAQRLPNVFVNEHTGHVGVGTNAPSNALSVQGSADVTGHLGLGTSTPQNRLDVEGGAVVGAGYAGTTPGPADGLLVEGDVGIGTHTPANKLSVAGDADFTGSVGIGTTDPTRPLEVAGTVRSTGANGKFEVTHPDNEDVAVHLGWLSEDGPPAVDVARIRVGGSGVGANNGLDIQGPDNNSLLRVRGNGNVGIGTTVPAAPLHVQGTDGGAIRVGGDSNLDYATLELFEDSDDGQETGIALAYDGERNELAFTGWAGGNDDGAMMTIERSGNVGVGTNDPQAKLDVNGSIRAWAGSEEGVGCFTFTRSALTVVTGGPSCSEATRGNIFVINLNTGVDAFCVCMRNSSQNYENTCFYSR